MFFVILFVSPLYFAIRNKWGGFLLNAFIYSLALGCVITILFAWIGVFFWMLSVGHAGWHLRTELMEQQAQMVAVSMAERMRGNEIDRGQERTGAVLEQKRDESRGYLDFQGSATSKKIVHPTIFCSSCGTQILQDSKFCEECGQALT